MNLIEVFLVVTIICIIAAIAIPNFSHNSKTQTNRHYIANFINFIKYARSQAILRAQKLVLTRNGSWQNGAILTSQTQSKPITLKQIPSAPHGMTIKVTAFPSSKQFTFNPDGLLGTSNGTITFTYNHKQTVIKISRTGRVMTSTH